MSIETYVVDATGRAIIDKVVVGDLDYSFDWTARLALVSDTLSTAVFSITGGATVHSQSTAGAVATIWVAGGAAGAVLALTCKITTVGGRTDARTIYIKVRAK